jgi:hypothetical protein
MAKEIIKKTISDAQLKNEYLLLFESGNTDNTNIYEQIRTKYKLAKERHVKMYHSTLLEWQETKNKATSIQIQANASDSLKSGLKSKIDRLLELQDQQQKLQDELHNNITVTTAFHNAELITAFRELSPLERTKIHQVIKEIRSEISKIEGDYAPTKQDVNLTDKGGADKLFIEK